MKTFASVSHNQSVKLLFFHTLKVAVHGTLEALPDPMTRGFLLPSLSERNPPITELTENMGLRFKILS